MSTPAALFIVAGTGLAAAYVWSQSKGGTVTGGYNGQPSPFTPFQKPNERETPDTNLNFDWLGGVTGWFSQTFGDREMKNNKPVNPAGSATAILNVSRDVLVLGRTIYGEARGESLEGKQAVANVVMNRVNSRRFPDSIERVCLQPWQFSCWNESDPNRAIINNMHPGRDDIFDTCLSMAVQAKNGTLPDVTGGADHYYASYIGAPSWIRNSPQAYMTAQIGAHKFYTGIA